MFDAMSSDDEAAKPKKKYICDLDDSFSYSPMSSPVKQRNYSSSDDDHETHKNDFMNTTSNFAVASSVMDTSY